MNLSRISILRNKKALCWYKDKLILCEGNKVYLYNPESKTMDFILDLSFKLKFQIFKKVRFINRLLRLDISYGYYSKNLDILFLAGGGTIFEINVDTRKIISSYSLNRGSRPLYLTEIQNIEGFDNGLYFGEYFNNTEFEAVNIYKRESSGRWTSVYKFPENSTYHIHNIIQDEYRNCVWVFTGDLDNHSGIWKMEQNFIKSKKVLGGSQLFRACVATVTKDALIYATDSQMEENFLCQINLDQELPIHSKLCPIEGSVIYGTKWQNQFIFSTTVEPGSFSTNLTIKQVFNRRRGVGIKSEYSKVMSYNIDTKEVKELQKYKKDFLPFYLFQFGTIIFPQGVNPPNYIVWSNVAVSRNEGSTEIFKCSNYA